MRLRAPRLLAAMIVSMLLVVPCATARAQQPTIGVEEMLGPIADVTESSMWLVASGQDPRFVLNTAAQPAWGTGTGPVVGATPGATVAAEEETTQIITRQVGVVSASAQPHLAVDPANPDRLALGVSTLDLPSVAVYVTDDGGSSWAGPYQAPHAPGDLASVGGPVLAFDRQGTLWLLSRSLGIAQIAAGSGVVDVPQSRVTIAQSVDGGITWGDPATIALAGIEPALASDEFGATRGELTYTFFDAPWLTIGPDPQRPERDALIASYTEFRVRFSVSDANGALSLANPRVESAILVQRSTDGGATWTSPIPVSPATVTAPPAVAQAAELPPVPEDLPPGQATIAPAAAPAQAAPLHVFQGARAAFLSDGTVLVAYLDATGDGPQAGLARVLVASSEDGGRTFSEPATAGIFHEIGRQPRTAFIRWWGSSFPRVAIGPEDEVMVAVTARPTRVPGDDGDILLLRSSDRGATWEPPLAIGDATGTSQFMPEVAFDPNGALFVAWTDMRLDPQRIGYDLFVAASDDLGETWREADVADNSAPGRRVSRQTANSTAAFAGGRYLGDRIALIEGDGRYSLAWPSARYGKDGRPELQVAFVPSSE